MGVLSSFLSFLRRWRIGDAMERPDDSLQDLPSFPPGFLWGSGTSPVQVEGETLNEWRDFVARDGTRPDDGPNHWRRYRFDFRRLADMNQNAYRLGFDWGRLQREPRAEFDRETAFRYMEMLAELRGHGITPFLTLFHFNCPAWLAARGGWLSDEAPHLFADFADQVAAMTDGEVRFWITINEPMVYAVMAYIMGEFPPRRRGRFLECFRVVDNLRRGHALAAEAIKSRYPDAQVGVTKHFKRFLSFRRWHPIDRLSAFVANRFFDRWGLEKFLRYDGRPVLDFVGVNYYGRMRMKGFNGLSPITGFTPEVLEASGGDYDDMWEQDPAWLASCLREVVDRTGLPIYITENGVATMDEALRNQYFCEHVRHCHAAITQGVDVRGYFYWSLLDNFEFGEGLTKKFGLLSVDFNDRDRFRRTRPIAHLYSRIAGRNGTADD